jgi:hypothetical protein
MELALPPYFDDFDDLGAAHDTYEANCRSLAQKGNRSAAIALRSAMGLHLSLEQLGRAIEDGHAPAYSAANGARMR